MRLIKQLTALSTLPALALMLAATTTPASAQTVTNPASPAIDEPYLPESAYDEYMRLGFAAEQDGDYVGAANYFRYALLAIPQDREATTAYWNARSQLQTNDLSDRAQMYEANMEAGYDATEESDYETASVYFQRALAIRPNDYYAAQALRNVYTYLTRGENATSPGDVPATYNVYANEPLYDRYMRLGYAAAQREDFVGAREYFRGALYDQPNDRTATVAYWNAVDAIADGEFGTNETAETNYDRFMRRGYDATERSNYVQAMRFFERALVERPQDGYAMQAIRNISTYVQ